jgi:hypothetical protein
MGGLAAAPPGRSACCGGITHSHSRHSRPFTVLLHPHMGHVWSSSNALIGPRHARTDWTPAIRRLVHSRRASASRRACSLHHGAAGGPKGASRGAWAPFSMAGARVRVVHGGTSHLRRRSCDGGGSWEVLWGALCNRQRGSMGVGKWGLCHITEGFSRIHHPFRATSRGEEAYNAQRRGWPVRPFAECNGWTLATTAPR